MTFNNDPAMDLTCTSCGQKFTERLARIKEDAAATCPACGHRLIVDATRAASELDAVKQAVEKLPGWMKKPKS